MPDWIVGHLKSMGLAGLVIFILLTTIGILSGVIVFLFKQNKELQAARLAEGVNVVKIAEANASGSRAAAEAQKDVAEATDELREAIHRLATTFEQLNTRIAFQYESMKEQLTRHGLVMDALAGSNRALDGIVTEVRNSVNDAKAILVEIKNIVVQLPRRR